MSFSTFFTDENFLSKFLVQQKPLMNHFVISFMSVVYYESVYIYKLVLRNKPSSSNTLGVSSCTNHISIWINKLLSFSRHNPTLSSSFACTLSHPTYYVWLLFRFSTSSFPCARDSETTPFIDIWFLYVFKVFRFWVPSVTILTRVLT